MMNDFLLTFVATLIGAGVGFAFLWRRRPERRNLPAMAVELVGLALGMSSSRLVFHFFPQLEHGWIRFATIVLLVWIIFLPAAWWASRIRGRANKVS